jgi:hypothetical protein
MPHEKPQIEQLMEVADVARAEGIVPATVRKDVVAGRLKVSAVTPRGTRLFRAMDVADYRNRRRLLRRKLRTRGNQQ